jgi:hypothetical protein
MIYVDNCCQWKSKLNSIFDVSLVKLDPFHAIQRFTSKIPQKGSKSCALRKLRSQMVTDFKLIIRQPSDLGKERKKSTATVHAIEQNIHTFLTQWKSVEFEGTKIIPQNGIDEINKLLVHVGRGCLSDIPQSAGTNRNEGIHRVLNKTLKKSRIGIQFALALLGVFFYIWNEKHLLTEKEKKKINISPPVESHFDVVERNENYSSFDDFGVVNDSSLHCEHLQNLNTNTQEESETGLFQSLQDCFQSLHDNDGSSSSEEEYDNHASQCISKKADNILSEVEISAVLKYSTSEEELFSQIQSNGQCEKFRPIALLFAKSSLTLLSSNSSSIPAHESSQADNLLTNYNMTRVPVPPNGNCFFLSVAHALTTTIIPSESTSNDVLQHFQTLGLSTITHDIQRFCMRLRELVVNEWIQNQELYKPFLISGNQFEMEAQLFLNDGHFAAELGNSMPLAMSNILKLPIVVVSQMQNLPIIPITPRETLQCIPIYVAFDHSNAGHYDAVVQVPTPLPPLDDAHIDKPIEFGETSSGTNFGRCGQGARKKEKDISSCDDFKKRCKCFQSLRGCTDNCQCIGCQNPHGKYKPKSYKNTTASLTRKRRAPRMTTSSLTGREFVKKQFKEEIKYRWTFFEELILVQLLQRHLCDNNNNELDIEMLHVQFSQFVNNSNIFPKTLPAITGKVVSYLNDSQVYKLLLKEQVRLNWFP